MQPANTSIVYGLVARDRNVILAEYTDFSGNFQQLVRQLLPKLQPDSKQSYETGTNQTFHCNTEGELTFVCLANEKLSKPRAYAFLESLRDKLFSLYSSEEIRSSIAYRLPFSEEIKRTMYHFNLDMKENKAGDVVKELNEVKNVMVNNLNLILERDVKLNCVLTKSERMMGVSNTFKTRAGDFRRQQQARSYISIFILVMVVLLFLLFIKYV